MVRVTTPARQREQAWEALINASCDEMGIVRTRSVVKPFRWLRSVDCALLRTSGRKVLAVHPVILV